MAGTSRMPGRGDDAASKAQETAATVGQKAQEAASSLGQKAQDVASSVAHKAQDVGAAVAHKTDDAIAAVGSGMSSLADTIRDKGPQSGMLGSATSTVASGLHAGGEYLQHHGVGDMFDDCAGIIRRYPIQSLLVGFGFGFLLARATSRG